MDKDNELEDSEQNDYQEYLRDMEQLKDDFSDLEDLDLDEIEAMREAISQVKSLDEEDIEPTEVLEEKDLNDEAELPQQEDMSPPVEQIEEPPIEIKEELMTDFSDLGKMDLEELIEMKKAVQEVQSEEIELDRNESSEASSTDELEKRLREELDIRREERKEDLMTEKKFLDYLKEKRDKIWYHALYYLAFEPEDHTASKEFLYEILKEETSKSAIDPIPEHQFYFGLGYILRLNIENSQVVRYKTGGKFKIEYNISVIRSLLKEAGEPISTKPTIEIEKQKKMFKDFLEDDFSDI